MSRYVRSITKTFEFDGGSVEVVLKPLTLGDLIALTAVASDPQQFGLKMSELLPKYVTSHTVKDAAGVDVSTEELASSAYFFPLAMEVGAALIKASQPANP